MPSGFFSETNLLTDALTTGSGELDGVRAWLEEGVEVPDDDEGEEVNQEVMDMVRVLAGTQRTVAGTVVCVFQ